MQALTILIDCRCIHDINITFDSKNYLDFIYEKKIKTAFTKFRLPSHDLAIQRGRYETTPRDERICKLCNSNMVENVYHFLLVFPKYKGFEAKIFKNVLLPMANTE